MRTRRPRWIPAYYLATPLFAAADGLFGANVRAAGLAEFPEVRALYYVVCLGCGIASWRLPRWGSFLGIAESSVNLLVLCLSVLLPQVWLADRILDGALVTESPVTLTLVVNFVLSSSVWLALFYGRGGLPALGRSARI